jgi:hypothetical protein
MGETCSMHGKVINAYILIGKLKEKEKIQET